MGHSVLVGKKKINGENVVFLHSLKEVIATKNGQCVQNRNAELQPHNICSSSVKEEALPGFSALSHL